MGRQGSPNLEGAACMRPSSRIFGADETLFVVGGTSTANKIVWHGTVSRGDLVLCDRNCHKSILHSLVMTGATPIYLVPSRNGLGIIGPISREQFTPESIRRKIAAIEGGIVQAVAIGAEREIELRDAAKDSPGGRHQLIPGEDAVRCGRVHVLPNHFAGAVHFEEAAFGSFADERVAVRQSLSA